MRAVAGKMLVAFERVVDDWAEGDPTVERRWASAEGVRADRDVCSPVLRTKPLRPAPPEVVWDRSRENDRRLCLRSFEC